LSKITDDIISTYLGGTGLDDDYETSMAIDREGNIFISGNTRSVDFPTSPGTYQKDFVGSVSNRFIAKFDPNLQTLLAATYLGGSSTELGMGLDLDGEGNVYVAGYTYSVDFPTTEGAFDRTHNGGLDLYISVLDNDLTKIIRSTYFGGSSSEGQQWPRVDIRVAENGSVYVAGLTKSSDLPLLENSYDKTYAGGGSQGGDAFVAKFDNGLTTLLGSTYLGGPGAEWRLSMEIDSDENIYICGETEGGGIPTTSRTYDNSFDGSPDIFITKFNNSLTDIIASTYFGSVAEEEALALRIDYEGNVILAGYTFSPSFPITNGVLQAEFKGVRDAFLAKFNPELTILMASTMLGGNNQDICRDMQLDSEGNIYITGNTGSLNFPTTNGAFSTTLKPGNNNFDGFLSVISNDLSTLIYSSYYGGTGYDESSCITIDNENNIYISGFTSSIDLPVDNNSFSSGYNGGDSDCFVARLSKKISGVERDEEGSTLVGFKLMNNYPNPFNPATTINFALPERQQVVLSVHNISGELIKILANGILESGTRSITWDGKNMLGNDVSSGMYLYSLNSTGKSITKKMILLR